MDLHFRIANVLYHIHEMYFIDIVFGAYTMIY
jgi:hypothetical protein